MACVIGEGGGRTCRGEEGTELGGMVVWLESGGGGDERLCVREGMRERGRGRGE
jgi:hypothetical protein